MLHSSYNEQGHSRFTCIKFPFTTSGGGYIFLYGYMYMLVLLPLCIVTFSHLHWSSVIAAIILCNYWSLILLFAYSCSCFYFTLTCVEFLSCGSPCTYYSSAKCCRDLASSEVGTSGVGSTRTGVIEGAHKVQHRLCFSSQKQVTLIKIIVAPNQNPLDSIPLRAAASVACTCHSAIFPLAFCIFPRPMPGDWALEVVNQ